MVRVLIPGQYGVLLVLYVAPPNHHSYLEHSSSTHADSFDIAQNVTVVCFRRVEMGGKTAAVDYSFGNVSLKRYLMLPTSTTFLL